MSHVAFNAAYICVTECPKKTNGGGVCSCVGCHSEDNYRPSAFLLTVAVSMVHVVIMHPIRTVYGHWGHEHRSVDCSHIHKAQPKPHAIVFSPCRSQCSGASTIHSVNQMALGKPQQLRKLLYKNRAEMEMKRVNLSDWIAPFCCIGKSMWQSVFNGYGQKCMSRPFQ